MKHWKVVTYLYGKRMPIVQAQDHYWTNAGAAREARKRDAEALADGVNAHDLYHVVERINA